MKRIFSGIQPSGLLHIGNYLGAIKQWVMLQQEVNEAIYCVVDLHAITVPQDPKKLKENIYSAAATYLAAGIDPEKSSIFVQSTRPEHAELAWILNCSSKMGELYRMTQLKDKTQKDSADNAGVGLFDYPVLMAADILLYGTTHVPVGEDQKQHVELTRDLAVRFNSRYGDVFTVPEPVIKKESARILGLDDPTKKMSKSATSANNYIALTDDPDSIRQKIKKAVTDSGSEIKSCADKPAITNMLNIYSGFSVKSVLEIEKEFERKSYGQFKDALSEEIISFLSPFQKKYQDYLSDRAGLEKILKTGSERTAPLAEKTLRNTYEKLGLGI